ncbi:protein 5NUC-like [Sitophilus oryzae]|uniref:5'-nucleotidase n=1 Tax=Sitophilus oryzae TaxID=7048 RepID=A0A6J2XHP2_SITOR|nr:protein 5NUC-like [Sitophilus oryzae]
MFVDKTNAPFVAANLNFTKEPSLSKVKKSVVLEVEGYEVGVVGYLTPETTKISSPGKVVFLDEVREVRREARRLIDDGVEIIIALGHSGYKVDKKIAREVKEVDIVIGGHTNTFLWNGKEPDLEIKEDVYPKWITQTSGKKVPVVQAYAYTKYLGVLNVTFDPDGNLKHASGQPIFLRNGIAQQGDVLGLLEVYRPAVVKLNQETVGVSKVVLDGNSDVRHKECNFGNFITDVHVAYVTSVSYQTWTSAPIGIYNSGGIRSTITPADNLSVSRGDLLGALPFGNQVVTLTLSGSNLLYAFEQMVRSEGETSKGEFPQVSGIRLQVDMSKPPYFRVRSVRVRCGRCKIPVYETLNESQYYTVVTSSFLSNGGDGITIFRDHAIKKTTQDLPDLEMMVWYIKKYSPLFPEVHGRIEILKNSGVRRPNNWTTMLLGIATLQILWRCI